MIYNDGMPISQSRVRHVVPCKRRMHARTHDVTCRPHPAPELHRDGSGSRVHLMFSFRRRMEQHQQQLQGLGMKTAVGEGQACGSVSGGHVMLSVAQGAPSSDECSSHQPLNSSDASLVTGAGSEPSLGSASVWAASGFGGGTGAHPQQHHPSRLQHASRTVE
jgi:hypothetical protein